MYSIGKVNLLGSLNFYTDLKIEEKINVWVIFFSFFFWLADSLIYRIIDCFIHAKDLKTSELGWEKNGTWKHICYRIRKATKSHDCSDTEC